MRPRLQRILAFAAVFLAGIAIGRFVVPLIEWREEPTAIFFTKKGDCGYALSTTKYFLNTPRYIMDGGETVKCGERKALSKDAFIACECE